MLMFLSWASGSEQRLRFFENVADVELLRGDGVASFVDLRGVEQILKQRVHPCGSLLHGVGRRSDASRGVRTVGAEGLLHHAAEHRNHRHGVSQIMRDHCNQLVTSTYRLLLATHLSGEVMLQRRTAQVVGRKQISLAPFRSEERRVGREGSSLW